MRSHVIYRSSGGICCADPARKLSRRLNVSTATSESGAQQWNPGDTSLVSGQAAQVVSALNEGRDVNPGDTCT